MVKIQVRETTLPIEIGEHHFSIDVSKTGIVSFKEAVRRYAEKTQAISLKIENNKLKYETGEKQIEKALEQVINELLGEGAFKKLFELSPNYKLISEYYVSICAVVTDELAQQGTRYGKEYEEKLKLYLGED